VTEHIELTWCERCGSYVARCEHERPDGLESLAGLADNVERGAKAASTLARGFRGALQDAAKHLGGRWGKK
jgi:hypothetical protein